MSDQPRWTAPGPVPDSGTAGPGSDSGSAAWSAPGSDFPHPPYGPPPQGPAYGAVSAPEPWPRTPRLEYRPGIIPLRPLTLSEVWSGVMAAVRGNPAATIGLALLTSTVVLVPFTALGVWVAGQPLTLTDPEARRALEPVLGSSGLAGLLGSYVPLLATYGTALLLSIFVALVVGYGVRGLKVGLGQTWELTRGRIPAGLGATVLMLVIFGAFFAAVGTGPVLLWASQSQGAGFVTFVALVIGVVGAVHLWVRLGFATSIVVLEHAGPWRSIVRSWRLTKGSRPFWRLLGIRLLTSVVASIIGSVISTPFTFVGFLVADTGTSGSLGWVLPVTQAVGVLIQAVLTTPFVSGVDSLLYIDQRIRREGLDVQIMQQLQTSPTP